MVKLYPSKKEMLIQANHMPKINELNSSFERDKKRNQSIITALRRGLFSNIRYLLENNLSDPNETYQLYNGVNLQISPTTLIPIISNINNPNSLPIISNLNHIINSIYSFNGRTPLMFCANIEDEIWSYGIAQNLIEKGAKVGLKDPHGLNALMYACIHQKKNLVKLYLNAPGDYSLLGVDNYGNTAMHIASLGQMESICKTLIDTCVKYDINPLTDIPKNKFGHTPFDLCVANGHKSCITCYNNINEHFSNKRAKQTQSRTLTQSVTKKEEPNVNKQVTSSNSALSDYNSNHSSRLSTVHNSMHNNNNNNHHHHHHHHFFNVNCPSILFENSESSITTNSPVQQNNETNEQQQQQNQIRIPIITPSNSRLQTAHPNISYSQLASARTTSASVYNHQSALNNHNTIIVNIMDIYKSIYPFKEQLIKVNVNELKKPTKPKMTTVKALIYELGPLNSTKINIKSKTKFENLKKEKNQQNQSKRILKSAVEKNIANHDDIKSQSDSQSNFKSVSFNNVNSVYEIAQNKLEQQNQQQQMNRDQKTWRNNFNILFESLQSQNSDSYRKSFRYTATSFEHLIGIQPPIVNNLNRRLSIQRKSIVGTGAFFNLGRKQSSVGSALVNMKMNMRRTSIIANS